MRDQGTPLETVIGLVVLAAVLTQTWVLVQEATQGDAGRQVRRWWATVGRPAVVRAVEWVDARDIAERSYDEEIAPYLQREAS